MEEGDILRQRRNLVAMSCLLIIFDLAKVKVAKVGVLGTDLIVGDVRVLAISMWVIWGYFLLRYYQFWKADTPHLSRALSDRLEQYARQHAVLMHMGQDSHGGFPSLERGGWVRGWRLELGPRSLHEGKFLPRKSLPVSWFRALLWRAKAAAGVSLNTPHFTEHALPFILAAATPVVALLTKIFAQS
jgi:hypothetical protein